MTRNIAKLALIISLSFGMSTAATAQVSPIVGLPSIGGPELPEEDAQNQSNAESKNQARGAFAKLEQDIKEEEELEPFGKNLFEGNFARSADDGLSEDYLVSPGDRIAVQTWGAIEVNEILTVDGQGNIFVPGIGPVNVSGGASGTIATKIRAAASKEFFNDFGLYANVLAVNPVGVYVTGFVTNPGRYAGIPSDSPLYFIDSAGGINSALGSYRDIEIKRQNKLIAHVDLYDFIIDGKLPVLDFKEGDTIIVRKRGPVVSLLGDVAEPSMLEFEDEQIIGEDALAIIPELVTATDIALAGMRSGESTLQTMDIEQFRRTALQSGDEIIVEGQAHKQTMLIEIEGVNEGAETMAVRRNMRLADLLHHIEVDPDLADLNAIHIRRKSVAEAQKKAILESLHRLERSALLALSDTQGESNIRVEEAKLMSEFVDRAKLIETLGNVVTFVDGQHKNILLEPDDVIVIPAKSNVVQISGEVFSSQAIAYKEGLDAGDYIKMAGGYSLRGDKSKIVIVRPNGEIIMHRNADIRPGDQILVPPKVDTKTFQSAIDMAELLSRIALTAGVIISL